MNRIVKNQEIAVGVNVKSVVVGSAAGAGVYLLTAYLPGFGTAVLPAKLQDVAGGASGVLLLLFVVELLIANILRVGILSALSVYLLVRYCAPVWWHTALAFVIAETLLAYAYLASVFSWSAFSFNHYILLLPHFIAVCIFAFIGAYGGRKNTSLP